MFQLIAMIVLSAVVSRLTRPKTQNAKAATLGDFDFPQSTEGSPQIEVFGTCWVSDWMVLGVGNFRTSPVRK